MLRSVAMEIVRARRAARLTQRELAEAMGVSQPVIARLESGRGAPSLATLERIAEASGQEIVLRFGPTTDAVRRDRVRKVLGDYKFDPLDRNPSEAEKSRLVDP